MIKLDKKLLIFIILAISSVFVFASSGIALAAPSASTGQAVLMSQRSVFLYGTVNPNGADTYAWFEFGTTSSMGSTRGYQWTGRGSSPVGIKVGLINLQINATYYYRIVAQGGNSGIINGEIKTFSTSSGSINQSSTPTPTPGSVNVSAPSVATNGPASVSNVSAVVNGSINPNNLPTNFWFEFGPTQSLGRTTTTGSISGDNSWQLIFGDLSGLESDRTYYYRVVAQNSYGINQGNIVSFKTTPGTSTSTRNSGQIVGTASSNASNSGGNNIGTTNTISEVAGPVSDSNNSTNSRPSFISLEYSLKEAGALVLVADDIRPKPGEEFSFTIVYRNDNQLPFNDARLKLIVPTEADFVDANTDWSYVSGNTVEFSLRNIQSQAQGAIIAVVRLKDDIKSDTSLIFTSVLVYKNGSGVPLSTTSFMTVRTGHSGSSDSSALTSLFGLISGSSAMIWSVILGLVVLMGLLAYGLRNGNNGNDKSEKNGNFSLENHRKVPPTAEFLPIDDTHPDVNEPSGFIKPDSLESVLRK